MLCRANLAAKVRSGDAKCPANRRLLEATDKSSRHRHGSDSSMKVLAVRRPCPERQTLVQQLRISSRTHRSEPYNSKVVGNGSSNCRKQQTTSNRSSMRPTNDQVGVAEPFVGVPFSADHGENSKGNEGVLWRLPKYNTLDRLQTLGGQRRKDLNFIEEVEACFSSSNSLSLVSEHVDEEQYPSRARCEKPLSSGRYTNLPVVDKSDSRSRKAEEGRTETAVAKVWMRKKEERRIGGLLLLNGLAAIYGSSNVANKYVAETAPALPASLTSLVKFSSALIFFIPALFSSLRNRETDLLRAGAELGALAFSASFVDSCDPVGPSSSSPALLYAFTVVFVPLMELFTGRQSGLKLTRVATLAAAVLGMGLLEEEGFGWKGIPCPQISDLWSVAVAVISALHIFRSDVLGRKFDPLRLNAVQCGVLAILSLGWELWNYTFDARAVQSDNVVDLGSLQSIPWVPLLYNGLVCSGLCSWLELRGLRSVHASTATLVYTTIPVWGAFLSFFTCHDLPTDSAFIGGAVIVVTSIYAQFISKDEEDLCCRVESAESKEHSNLEFSTITSVQSTEGKMAASKENDYFPAGLLVSQLKFPYYAAQAKGLLADIKLKVGALKSLGLVFTGISSSSILPAAPGNPPASSAFASSSSVHSSVNATTTTLEANNLTTSHINLVASHAIEVSNADSVQVPIPHGIDIAATTAMSALHSSSNILAHLSTSITTGLGSALVVVSSDLMMAVEEAEGVAMLIEKLVQGEVESATHVVAACLAAGISLGASFNTNLNGSGATPQVAANFVESDSQFPAGALDFQTDFLMNSSHLIDTLVNAFSHFGDLILALINSTMM